MRCTKCGETAVISTHNGTLCEEHFKENFERIVLKTIKKYKLFKKGETLVVANSGGKDSLSLLYIMAKNFSKSNRIISVTIDEGIKGYRDKTIETMKKYCGEWGVDYVTYGYKDFSGYGMDEIVKREKGIPCATCGILRRHLLNAAALDKGADKLLTAHNMDDEAESVLMNLFQNDFEKLLRSGPISGVTKNKRFVPRVKPFMFVSEKETMLFSILNGIDALHTSCPYAGFGFRGVLARKVKLLETEFPGSKEKIIRTSLRIKDKHAASAHSDLRECSICGAPTPETVCETCRIKNRLTNKSTF